MTAVVNVRTPSGASGPPKQSDSRSEPLVALERLKRKARAAVAAHGPHDEHVVGAEAKRAQQPGAGDFRLQFGVLCAVFDLENPAVRQLAMKLLRASVQLLDDETAGHFVGRSRTRRPGSPQNRTARPESAGSDHTRARPKRVVAQSPALER